MRSKAAFPWGEMVRAAGWQQAKWVRPKLKVGGVTCSVFFSLPVYLYRVHR